MSLPSRFDFSEKWNDSRIFSSERKEGDDTKGIRVYTGRLSAKIMKAFGLALDVPVKSHGEEIIITVNKKSAQKFFSEADEEIKLSDEEIKRLITSYKAKTLDFSPEVASAESLPIVSPKVYEKRLKAEIAKAAQDRMIYLQELQSKTPETPFFLVLFESLSSHEDLESRDILDAVKDCKLVNGKTWTGDIMKFIDEALDECLEEMERKKEPLSPESAVSRFIELISSKMKDEIDGLGAKLYVIDGEREKIKKEREKLYLELNGYLKTPKEGLPEAIVKAIQNDERRINFDPNLTERNKMRRELFLPEHQPRVQEIYIQLRDTDYRKKQLLQDDISKLNIQKKKESFQSDRVELEKMLGHPTVKKALLKFFQGFR